MRKVLVVEDDPETQEIYKQILSENNIEVIQAKNGHEGLDLVRSTKPDLIILDIMLPGGLNGFDVLEQLKRDVDFKATPVIMLTNLDTEEKTAKQIGASDYIVKTTTSLDEVVKKVQQLLPKAA